MADRPTIKDVAKAASVSIGTVSKVINNDPTVHPAIKKVVDEVIAQLGYRPSPLARSFQRGRTRAIGFVVGDLSIESYLAAIPLAQEIARSRDYALIVADSGLDRTTERKNIQMLIDMRVEGLLWRPVFPVESIDTTLLAHTSSVVFMSPNDQVTSVSPDAGVAFGDMADDLAMNGHETVGIALLEGASSPSLIDQVVSSLRKRGLRAPSGNRHLFSSRDDCRRGLAKALRGRNRPSALIVGSALLSATLLAAEDAGLDLPGDLSAISIADSDVARTFRPHISAIRFDRAVEARLGMAALFEAIDGDSSEARAIRYAGEYVRRSSVGPARVHA